MQLLCQVDKQVCLDEVSLDPVEGMKKELQGD